MNMLETCICGPVGNECSPPSSNLSLHPPPLSGTRETAVLYALLTAGAATGVAQACHDQAIEGCCELSKSTGEDEEGNLIYYNCNDNVEWALRNLDEFIGVVRSSPVTTLELMHEHNTHVGEKVRTVTVYMSG